MATDVLESRLSDTDFIEYENYVIEAHVVDVVYEKKEVGENNCLNSLFSVQVDKVFKGDVKEGDKIYIGVGFPILDLKSGNRLFLMLNNAIENNGGLDYCKIVGRKYQGKVAYKSLKIPSQIPPTIFFIDSGARLAETVSVIGCNESTKSKSLYFGYLNFEDQKEYSYSYENGSKILCRTMMGNYKILINYIQQINESMGAKINE